MRTGRRKYIRFAFARRQTKLLARDLVKLEKRFNNELNNITLPCGEKIKLASSISRYERVRLMMTVKGFREDVPVKNYEYAARLINAYLKNRGRRTMNYEL
jgi:hypothetical protein